MDVTKEDEVVSVTRSVVDQFGSLTLLVNNAGITGANKPTDELTSEEWDQLMNVNVKGVFLCTKHALRHILPGKKGSIINLSSIYGLIGAANIPAYHASKGAVRLVAKTDAMIDASKGIRVNSVHPGLSGRP